MAFRRPLKIFDSDLKEMSDAEIASIQNRMIHLYGKNPTVTLSVVSSGGNLGTITEQRLLAGPNVEDGGLTEVSTNTIFYSRINQIIDSSVSQCLDTNYRRYPVYFNDSGHIQAMNDSDFVDTFLSGAIDTITSSTISDDQAGTYFISNTNLVSNASLISNIPVFVDTLADADAFTSGPLPEDIDQYINVTNYYLHQRVAPNPIGSYQKFLVIDSNYDLRELNDSDTDDVLECYIRWAAVHSNGNRIRYSYDSGNPRGTGMIDTILESDNAVIREGDTLDDYEYNRQEVPAGDPIINQIHYLRIKKT